jgi:hypothetical protein
MAARPHGKNVLCPLRTGYHKSTIVIQRSYRFFIYFKPDVNSSFLISLIDVNESRDSSALGDGVLRFDSQRGLGIFLFTTASRTALGPTQSPIQGVPGALSLGVKRPMREADYSPPSSAEVKNVWSYTSTPPMSSLCSA